MFRCTHWRQIAYLNGFAVLAWTSAGDGGRAANPSLAEAEGVIRVGMITERGGPHLGIYLNAVAACSGVAAAAVSDQSGSEFDAATQILGKAFDDVPTYRSHADMLAEFQPSLVIVTLPAHASPPPIRLALESGCHVISEKPGCVRAEQFASLVQLAEQQDRLLMLSLPSRVGARSLRAREIVAQGLLGKLYALSVLQVKDQARLTRPSYHQSWFASRETAGGGHLIWLGIHQIDQIAFITGARVEKVTAFCRNVGGQPVEIEDAEAVALQFANGMLGTFHGGYYLEGGAMQSGLTIWGSQGWLRLSAERGAGGSSESFQWHSTHPDAPRGIQSEDPQSAVEGYQAFVQAAIDAARGTRPAPLTAQDSLRVLQVIFAAYRAAETGTAQTLP